MVRVMKFYKKQWFHLTFNICKVEQSDLCLVGIYSCLVYFQSLESFLWGCMTKGVILIFYKTFLLTTSRSHTKIAELQQAQARRPATASPSADSTPPSSPPGLSISSFRRVMGDNPYEHEQLEKVKLGIVKFLGADLFKETEVVCHYIIGSADTRHRYLEQFALL